MIRKYYFQKVPPFLGTEGNTFTKRNRDILKPTGEAYYYKKNIKILRNYNLDDYG